MPSPTISEPDLPTGLPYIIDDMTDAGGGCFPQPQEESPLPLGLLDPAWWEGGCFPGGPGPGLPYDLFGEDNGKPSTARGGVGAIGGMMEKIKDAADKAAKGAADQGASPFEDMICY